MNLSAVMDDVAVALGTIPGLRVFPYWPDRINPPTAVVAWPDGFTYDSTFARGADELELPVHVMVGKPDVRSARDQLAAYVTGSGPASVKAAVDGHESTTYDAARVDRCEFGVITGGGVEYLAATFYIKIIGRGA